MVWTAFPQKITINSFCTGCWRDTERMNEFQSLLAWEQLGKSKQQILFYWSFCFTVLLTPMKCLAHLFAARAQKIPSLILLPLAVLPPCSICFSLPAESSFLPLLFFTFFPPSPTFNYHICPAVLVFFFPFTESQNLRDCKGPPEIIKSNPPAKQDHLG